MMRFVVYGAGAIGATIGAGLHEAGHPVTLIARGPHLEALQRDGLEVQTPDGSRRLAVPAVAGPAEATIEAGDVVLLAMKTQDTDAALGELQAAADPRVALVCAQNGVENERLALRRFREVYGMCVYLPAQHLEPGVVQVYSQPTAGVLDLGRLPAGADGARGTQIAAALRDAGFASEAVADVMPWKYDKLLANLGNAVSALFGPDARGGHVVERARAEALACYAAAGINVADPDAVARRREALSPMRPVNGQAHAGGSSWQSLQRGSGSVEADYLNGEIALLGRLHGVATPVNVALADTAVRMARERARPGSADPEAFEALIARTRQRSPGHRA
jgi:2-dehydropantoate 2-reductase